MTGFVSIVGAGPGDVELLTLKALRRLRRADLVLYDALVAPETIRYARRARLQCVGKRAGRASTRQETIHDRMIAAARRGRRVVRLKGGDPFVLGRGGEEMVALQEAGIPYEIIPGVSSAIAAPALAGIPVTHRGLSSGFLVLSGHCPDAYGPILGGVEPHSVTVVILMGGGQRAGIARILLRRGWSGDTPTAALSAVATPRASAWVGTLGELGRSPHDEVEPVTLAVGEVVSLALSPLAVEGAVDVLRG